MAERLVSDTWQQGSPYENYVGRWSRRVAPLFLAWLDMPAGRRPQVAGRRLWYGCVMCGDRRPMFAGIGHRGGAVGGFSR